MSETPAYMIVTCIIDSDKKQAFSHYVKNARPLFGAYGGRPVGQYAIATPMVGTSGTTHVIVMGFPSHDAIRNVLSDPAYQELVPARTEAFPTLDIMIADAFDPTSMLVAAP